MTRSTSRIPSLGPALGLTVVLVLAGGTASAQDDDPLEAERLLFLLQYIGADYGAAVEDGRIINALEFDEMVRFQDLLVEHFDVLRRAGASPGLRPGLEELGELIGQLAPWDEVRTVVSTLTGRLMDELSVVTQPTATPDVRRGAQLYAQGCAACHGPRGAGDGFGDPAMDPPATSFRDARMNILSPHQVYGATSFGIDGTAMPAYGETLPPEDLWDIAFHVLTLREDFDPRPFDPGLGLTLEDLVVRSNDELLARLEADGRSSELADIDHYRRTPPAFRLPASIVERTAPAPPARASTPPVDLGSTSSLGVAVALQDAFSAVAERIEPSIVSVTAFVRDPAAEAEGEARSRAPGWTGTDAEAYLYPGFRRLRSASGFFVDDEGYLFTCYSSLLKDDGQLAEAIDVELPDGRHILSRLVGAEPTVDLAILQLEVVSRVRPPTIQPAPLGRSDLVRTGHWMIALGDPWGPERTYAVGALSAPPQRECYQGELSATLMQSSVSIHPEAYGGPLADIHGRVVGMNVTAPGATIGLPRASQYALPIDLAVNLYSALKLAESRRSPWLGFSVLELAAARRDARKQGRRISLPLTGVYIDDLFEPSPAAAAGVRIGDSLVSIEGRRLLSVLDFQKWLYLSGIGRTVTLEIHREGETLPIPVTIEERPPEAVTR